MAIRAASPSLGKRGHAHPVPPSADARKSFSCPLFPPQPPPIGAHSPEAARLTAGARPADLPTVADQVDVELVGVLGVDDPKHLVVRFRERGALAEEPEPPAHPVDVRID